MSFLDGNSVNSISSINQSHRKSLSELPDKQADEETYDIQTARDRISLYCAYSAIYQIIRIFLNILGTDLLVSRIVRGGVIVVRHRRDFTNNLISLWR